MTIKTILCNLDPYNLAKQLNSFLNKACDEIEKIDLAKSDEDNKATLTSFTSNILQILDNSFNYYPNCNNDDYYPRPKLRESRNEYILRIKDLKRKKVKITNSLRQFLINVFDINAKYRHALSLLEPKLKHKTGEKAHTVKEPSCEYSLTSKGGENPVKINPDGSMDIGSFIHAEPGAHVSIKGGRMVSPTQDIYIENLQYMLVNSGIVDFSGEQRKIDEWMTDCITICQELITLIKQLSR